MHGSIRWVALVVVVACGGNSNNGTDASRAADAPGDTLSAIDAPVDAPLPAALTVSPANTDFGPIVVGATSATVSFTVTNSGLGASDAIAAVISGANSADFAVATTDCTTLAGGASCTVDVTFTPDSTLGAKSSSLAITTTSSGAAATASLSGTSIAANAVSITPTIFSFGSHALDTTTSTTFTVSNAKATAVTTSTATLLPASPDFTIIANTCTTIAPGTSCSVTVRFAPTVSGDFAAETLSINTSGGTPTATITGHGESIADVDWTERFAPATPFDFGSTLGGELGAQRTFTLKNNGETTSGTITGFGFASPGTFKASADGCTGHSLAPGATCAVTLQFTPADSTTTTDDTGTVTAAGVTGLTNTSLFVIGRSIAPGGLVLTPATASFPSTTVGTTSVAQTFTVQNTSLLTQTFDLATLSAKTTPITASTSFVITASTCGPIVTIVGEPGVVNAPLAAGESCTVSVAFTPASVGSAQAFLFEVLNDAVAGVPTDAYTSLAGTGAAP